MGRKRYSADQIIRNLRQADGCPRGTRPEYYKYDGGKCDIKYCVVDDV